ncbi:MAG: hypothetical protein NUV47_03520 [Patescibacteria group bacterium]|nr:hypothetical protein [Patescibacteria group bacterium]
MKTKFARCFPLPDGNMCCKHWNGNYIVFPMKGDHRSRNEKSPNEEDDSEE